MSLREKQAKFWMMVAMLINKAREARKPIVILEWLRDIATQRAYVARRASKTMKSKHLQGLAIDVAFLSDILDDGKINYHPDEYKFLGEYWESLGGRWGGRFGDDPTTETIEGWDAGHFEYQESLASQDEHSR